LGLIYCSVSAISTLMIGIWTLDRYSHECSEAVFSTNDSSTSCAAQTIQSPTTTTNPLRRGSIYVPLCGRTPTIYTHYHAEVSTRGTVHQLSCTRGGSITTMLHSRTFYIYVTPAGQSINDVLPADFPLLHPTADDLRRPIVKILPNVWYGCINGHLCLSTWLFLLLLRWFAQ